MRPITARTKLLIALAAILTVSFVGVSLLNYTFTREMVRQEIITDDLPLTRDNIYSELSAEIIRPIMVASSMANDSFLKDWAREGEKDVGKIVKYLKGIEEKYGFISTFFVSALTGKYYHYSGVHKTVDRGDAHDAWFYDFVDSGKEYELDVDTDEAADNTLTIFINYRVMDDSGRLLGVTGVGLKMDAVARLVGLYQKKYDRLVYLVGPNGLAMVHPDRHQIERFDIHDVPGMAPLAYDMLVRRGEPGDFQYERDGRDIMVTVRYVPELDWFIFVEQDETRAMASARMNFARTVLIGLAASVVIIFLTLATINRYQRRVEAMAVTDELTGAANRRRLEMEFNRALALKRRRKRGFSLVLLDLDDFKGINDTIGHLAGDQVLVQVAGLVSGCIRPSDLLARWGGDEFVILAEGSAREAAAMADRLRADVRDADLADPGAPADDPRRRVTLSAGVAECAEDDDLDSLLKKADEDLYRCKALRREA